MIFRQHLGYGFVASAIASASFAFAKSGFELPITADSGDIALVFGLCLAGSLAPDLDTQSTPSRIVAIFGFFFCSLSLFHREPYPALIFATAFIFIKSLSHRGWIHTYTLPLILVVMGIVLQLWMIIPFSLGIIVHFKCDGMKVFKKSNWVKSFKIL